MLVHSGSRNFLSTGVGGRVRLKARRSAINSSALGYRSAGFRSRARVRIGRNWAQLSGRDRATSRELISLTCCTAESNESC